MTPFRLIACRAALACILLAAALSAAALARPDSATEVILERSAQARAKQQLPEPLQETSVAANMDVTENAQAAEMNVLSLAEALQRALTGHPGLSALQREYQAQGSIAWQQGRKPNPELELELGEFGGTDEARGFRSLATSLTYTQSLERGGKRSLRELAARLESELIAWDMAELEHEIQAEVRLAYAAAQAARFELEQLESYHGLVRHIYDTVATRVEAGRSARLELERLDIELARLDLAQASAQRRRQQADLALAGSYGASAVDFTMLEPALAESAKLATLEQLEALLDELPAIARHAAQYDVYNALLELENANSVSDLAWFGGVSRLNEIQETVFSVGVSLSLPVHDRNEGNINAAYHRREQVEFMQADARRELQTRLAILHQQAGHALENHQAYGASLLPSANEALALTEEGYRYGKFELLDVLDAQRTVLELEAEQSAALMEYRGKLAEIEALLNISLQDQTCFATPEHPDEESMDSPIASTLTEVSENE